MSQTLFDALDLEQRGRMREAAETLRTALRSDPNNAELLRALGRVLLHAGFAQEAKDVLRQAQLRNPKSAEVHANRGIALVITGDAKRSILHFERAIAIVPDFVLAYFNLGIALQLLSRHEDAVSAFETVVRFDPRYCDAHINVAVSLMALERHAEAITHCQKALAAEPSNALALYNMAVALQELLRLPEATAQYQRAIALKPDYADAHHGLGIALQMMGRSHDAHQALARAAELAPQSGRLQRDLAESCRVMPDDPLIVHLQELTDRVPPLSPTDRVHLHAALGKALADVGEHKPAFENVLQANAIQRAQIDYDERKTLSQFDRVRSIFSAQLLREKAGFGDPSSVPIFVIGMPRSGSTLIEQILASHSSVFGAGETKVLSAAIASIGQGPFASAQFFRGVRDFSQDQLAAIGKDYVQRIALLAPQAERVNNKFLNNFMCAGLISLCLPNAKIVHIFRNPLDCCVSRFMSVFVPGSAYAYDLAELGRYYREYELMMEHWRSALPPRVMLDLKYEDLISDPESQMRRLLLHCGLNWEDSCLDFHKTERVVATPTRQDVRKKMYDGSVGRWMRYREYLAPLLKALNRDANGDLASA